MKFEEFRILWMRRSSFYDDWIKFVMTKKFAKCNGSAKDKLRTVEASGIPNSDSGSILDISTDIEIYGTLELLYSSSFVSTTSPSLIAIIYILRLM